jgi:hypothetical protein
MEFGLDGTGELEESMCGSIVNASRVDNPAGWTANNSTYVSRLRKNIYKVDPGRLLKVMGGDLISSTVQYYYPTPVTNANSSSIVNEVVAMLGSLIGSSTVTSNLVKGSATQIVTQAGNNTGFANFLTQNASSSTPNQNKASLNIVSIYVV